MEKAFEDSHRVMTLSFHHYDGDFFPGTGNNISGLGRAINVPLKTGASDALYSMLFEDVLSIINLRFHPSAIVLQCGADSVSGDTLGREAEYNLSSEGHAQCVKAVKNLNIPLVVLGGGGYTPANVAKCWTRDTSALCGVQLEDTIPSACLYKELIGNSLSIESNQDWKDHNLSTRREYRLGKEKVTYLSYLRSKITDAVNKPHPET